MVAKQKFLIIYRLVQLTSKMTWSALQTRTRACATPYRDLKINLSLHVLTFSGGKHELVVSQCQIICTMEELVRRSARFLSVAEEILPCCTLPDRLRCTSVYALAIIVEKRKNYTAKLLHDPTDLRRCSKLLIAGEDNETSLDNGMGGQWWRFTSEFSTRIILFRDLQWSGVRLLILT